MRAFVSLLCAALVALAMPSLCVPTVAQAEGGLQITFGPQGLQTLSYRGQVLEDVGRFPADVFHIWHMKSTDLSGRALTTGQNGWGEASQSRAWDAATHTWTYRFQWGSLATQYTQHADTLDIHVTTVNRAGSGIRFAGATLYPLALHFPQLPRGFTNASYNQFAFNSTGPSVTVADFGSGEVIAAVPDAAHPLYSGFQPAGGGNVYTAIVSSTSPDSLATFQPHNDRLLAPGQTDQFTVSLRFAPAGTPARTLAADVYAAWAGAWPSQLQWTDRRIIGTAFLASSAQGDSKRAAGFTNNPRRYFNSGDASTFDVRNPAGLARFQQRILRQAAEIVANSRRLHAQGVITWDIEGEQFPMNTSYVCSPDQIASVAPEMESTITDEHSPYRGMKLADAYFRTIRDAGFRVGVCVRPQQFVLHGDGSAEQVTLASEAEVTERLVRKLRYAHDRWGATLFYIDSTVDATGAPLSATVFQRAAASLPDSLLIPEESTPKHYAYTAPFLTFLFHGDLGTDATVYSSYPHAFSANLINDVDRATLAAHRGELTASVRRGDILLVHADSWHPNNDTVLQMYAEAARGNNGARASAATARSLPAVR